MFTGRGDRGAARTVPVPKARPAPAPTALTPGAEVTPFAPTHIREAARAALGSQVRPAHAEAAQDEAESAEDGPLVIENLMECRAADEVLVLEYGGQSDAPALTLEHAEAAGLSQLYADGELVLEVRYAEGEPQLTLDEIVVAAR
ncbi:hypothetical protein [Pseudooceanicola sp. LIPI14-2-Ac024]|uniref:hypothetical protein n=1 Tax=Pseudooceanicola sp. LIPI14-2-Ac024 TaxID=3344875 RepID=UPI0035CF9BB6